MDQIVHQWVEFCYVICDIVYCSVCTETELSVKDVTVICHVWISAANQVDFSQFVTA